MWSTTLTALKRAWEIPAAHAFRCPAPCCDHSPIFQIPMENALSRTRRRQSRGQSPAESSDELPAGSEREETKRRRTSWSQKNSTPQRRTTTSNKRQYDESDSPGEVAGEEEDYWHGSNSHSRPSPSPIDRPTPIERSHEDRSLDESDALSEDRREREEHNHHPSRDDVSDRISTPVPPANETPPPTPKPESLNYKEKYVLKAHLRGVSTVQFSPDCSMIASGGMSFFTWFTVLQSLIIFFPRLRRRHQGLGDPHRQTYLHIRGPPRRNLNSGLEPGRRVDCLGL